MKQRLIYIVAVGMSLSSSTALAYGLNMAPKKAVRPGEHALQTNFGLGSFDCAERRNKKLLESQADLLQSPEDDVKAGQALGAAHSASEGSDI